MGKNAPNRFFEVYLQISAKNPEMMLKDCYEMAEKWHKWKFGRRRYKSLEVFKSTFSQKINKSK